jgi:hypothetical protein
MGAPLTRLRPIPDVAARWPDRGIALNGQAGRGFATSSVQIRFDLRGTDLVHKFQPTRPKIGFAAKGPT